MTGDVPAPAAALDELRGLLPEAEIEALAKLAADAEDPAVRAPLQRDAAQRQASERMARGRARERSDWDRPCKPPTYGYE